MLESMAKNAAAGIIPRRFFLSFRLLIALHQAPRLDS